MALQTLYRLLQAPMGAIGVTGLLGLFVFYLAGIVIYRLYFHPLSRFPGPKLAAATLLYEFYYDVICDGQYTFHLAKLHERYGPIIRISPEEIHIHDADFYDALYTNANNPREKWAWTADAFGVPTSFFASCTVDLHRARRAPLNHFFSRRAVTSLTPLIVTHVDKLCNRLSECKASGRPVSLKYAYGALTMDVITEYCFSKPYASLDDPDFGSRWMDSIDSLVNLSYLQVYFPILTYVMERLPPNIVKKLAPASALMIDFQLDILEQVKQVMRDDSQKPSDSGQKTIFHELIHSNELPVMDRTLRHFRDEGQVVVAAGQLTTASHLQMTTYAILTNPSILSRLKSELATVMPHPQSPLPSLEQLEQLPYLSATVLEGHRYAIGLAHRSQRISPNAPIIYGDFAIPPGTPVGMSAMLQHYDPKLFPSPTTFDPDRFIKQPSMKQYLVHFPRGTRSCIGQNLANAELYFTLAALFTRFNFEIHDTNPEDMKFTRDMMVPLPARGAKGLSVMVL